VSLNRIVLRDFVIVKELDLEIGSGFTVLTGETGAGKSILIDALQLVTGGRADIHMIRESATRTDVSAEFDPSDTVCAWLTESGFDSDSGLMLRRTVDLQGKSRSWINGSPATATQLRALGAQLLDIHGQHAWQSLTRADTVRDLLDAYANLSTSTLAELWHRWRACQSTLANARASQDTLLNERERLSWQIGELEKLAPNPDEWEELNAEHSRLSHAQALLDAAQEALSALNDDDTGVILRVGNACESLQKQEHIEPYFKGYSEVLASSLAQMEDVVHSLRTYLRKTELDPQRLQSLDDRMGLWVSLARRYKRNPEDLASLLATRKLELQTLEASADLNALERAEQQAQEAYKREARKISKTRHGAAPRLGETISSAMQTLGMQGGRFEVALTPSNEPLQSGLDDVMFMVAGHAGSTPRPVNKVASGGELSRMALAIAVTTSQLGTAQTLIFDEVDSGVGGAVAETVGRLMRQLGTDRQVLAVTHLAQVAACANHHLVVSKQLVSGSTLSSVESVDSATRVSELARMLGGERILDSTLTHARDMLNIQQT